MPNVVILAGPNGAGKSTAAPTLLRDLFTADTFVNVEEIGRSLARLTTERATSDVDLKLQVLRDLARKRVDLGFETTLAGIDFSPFIRELKDAGYRFRLLYVWVESADLAVQRVRSRAQAGGQAVDESIVRRRYEEGIRNLFAVYLPLADAWSVHDNSGADLRLIAEGPWGNPTRVHDAMAWEAMQRRAGA